MSKYTRTKVADLASQQWGLVTTQQAALVGVDRLKLSRMVGSGFLVRERQGVYRVAGAPEDWLTELRTQWLALKPNWFAFDRLKQPHLEPTVASVTASWLHGVGSFLPAPYIFHAPTRIQKSSELVKIRTKRYLPQDIQVIEGLPVTNPTQTVIDLLEDRQDLEGVLEVTRDFGKKIVNLSSIALEFSRLAKPLGLTTKQLRRHFSDLDTKLEPVQQQLLMLESLTKDFASALPSPQLDPITQQKLVALGEAVDNLKRELKETSSL